MPSDRLPLNLSSSLFCRRLRSRSRDMERRYCLNLPYLSLSSDLDGTEYKLHHPVKNSPTHKMRDYVPERSGQRLTCVLWESVCVGKIESAAAVTEATSFSKASG